MWSYTAENRDSVNWLLIEAGFNRYEPDISKAIANLGPIALSAEIMDSLSSKDKAEYLHEQAVLKGLGYDSKTV